jgi:monoamine oxidase
MKGKRAIIVGGSIAGLFAGNYLVRRGWNVDVLETAPETLASRGQGIARHAELEELLDLLDVPRGMSGGIDVSGRTAFDHTGRLIAEYRLDQQLCAWNQVYLALSGSFRGVPVSSTRGTNHAGWPNYAETEMLTNSDLPESYAVAFANEGSVTVQMVEFGYGGEIRIENSPDYAEWDRETMVR